MLASLRRVVHSSKHSGTHTWLYKVVLIANKIICAGEPKAAKSIIIWESKRLNRFLYTAVRRGWMTSLPYRPQGMEMSWKIFSHHHHMHSLSTWLCGMKALVSKCIPLFNEICVKVFCLNRPPCLLPPWMNACIHPCYIHIISSSRRRPSNKLMMQIRPV